MEVDTETETSSSSPPSSSPPVDLIAALEQAALMAKHLSPAADQSHLLQIHAALHSAHRHLSLFLHPPPPPPPQSGAPQPENSVSSAVGGGGGDEPMQIGDDEDEQSSRVAVEKVEGRLRDFSIRSKRLKRQLSPAAAAMAERRRSYEYVAVLGGGGVAAEFDPVGTKLRALDLIYQFHA